MVDRKENYKFDLGVKGLNSKSKCLRLLALTRLILSRQSDIIVCKDGFLFLLHNSSFAFHSISFFGPKYCVTLRNNLNGIRCIYISYVFFSEMERLPVSCRAMLIADTNNGMSTSRGCIPLNPDNMASTSTGSH